MNMPHTHDFKLSNKVALFVFLGIAAVCYYSSLFYPGYLTPDSAYILFQTTDISPLSNWHPVFVTELWGLLYDIFKSAGGLWMLQIIVFILSAAGLSFTLKNYSLSIVLFLFLCFYPPVITNMAALWKDDWAVILTMISLYFFIVNFRQPDIKNQYFWCYSAP